jgi:hypothetical protein
MPYALSVGDASGGQLIAAFDVAAATSPVRDAKQYSFSGSLLGKKRCHAYSRGGLMIVYTTLMARGT